MSKKPKPIIKTVKLTDIHEYKGNPRQIKKDDFEILKKSLKEFPEMLDVREIVIDEDGAILGGNQRYRALLANGETEATVKQVVGWSEAKKREFVIKDNIANGDWDMDTLANEWDDAPLGEWGLSNIPNWSEDNEVYDVASEGSIKDYDEDTNYDLGALYKDKVNNDIMQQIIKGDKDGEIRPEIKELLLTRAKQCSVFDFGQITKFYRSGDASETEKELLKRLYLVFITPREAFEAGILEVDSVSGKIQTKGLMESDNEQ